MDLQAELGDLLRSTAQLIEFAFHRIPGDRLFTLPPHSQHPQSGKGFKNYFGDWSAMRHLFHLVFYEETFAIPTMSLWLDEAESGIDLMVPEALPEEAAWQTAVEQGIKPSAYIDRLYALRTRQVMFLKRVPSATLTMERADSDLGRVTLAFVVEKTIQHSVEHADALWRNALHWDRALAWLDELGLNAP